MYEKVEPMKNVVIIGRPNVVKSTLFNRLIGKRRAITDPTPGVTRDPISEKWILNGHAVNLTESASELHSRELSFSPGAQEELQLLRQLVEEILDKAGNAFMNGDRAEAFRIEPLEEVVDELVALMRNRHLIRLRNGECSVSDGIIFQDILVNAERISDQCSNIGVHTLSLADAAVAAMEHDYILHLHQGENEAYNAEYTAVRKRYLARLTGGESEESKE